MQILLVSNLYPPFHHGGYGMLSQWCAEGLATRGHEVRVLTSIPVADEIGHGEEGIVPVMRQLLKIADDLSPLAVLCKTLHNSRAVRRAIRDFRPDVVYCLGIDGVGFNSYHAATESGVPAFATVGDSWLAQAWTDLPKFDRWCGIASAGQSRGARRILKLAFGNVGRILGLHHGDRPCRFHPVGVISTFLADSLRASGIPSDAMISIIPPMLPTQYFNADGKAIGHSGKRTSVLRALFIGRIEMLKGPDIAIRGLAAACSRGADVRLSIGGLHIEKLQGELQALAKSLRIDNRIDWLGTPRLDELVSVYRAHDVFLFPSRIVEGFGLVNAEAMACGLPVIGTAHSGSADAIVDNVTGFRIVTDDSDSLGLYLHRLANDRTLLEALSRSASESARRYHPSGVIDRLEAALFEVVDRNNTAISKIAPSETSIPLTL